MSLGVGAECEGCGSEVRAGRCSYPGCRLPPGRHTIVCRAALQVRLAGTPATLVVVTEADIRAALGTNQQQWENVTAKAVQVSTPQRSSLRLETA